MKLKKAKVEKILGVCKKCNAINTFLRFTFKMPNGELVALEVCAHCLLSTLDEV